MPIRCLTAAACSMAMLAGVTWYRESDCLPAFARVRLDPQGGVPEAEQRTWNLLEDHARRRTAFLQFETRLIAGLRRKETNLRAVTERLFYYCLQHFPEHLENVCNAERGGHIKTKLAQNILRSVESEQEASGGDPAIVGYFEGELQAIGCEEHAAATLIRQ